MNLNGAVWGKTGKTSVLPGFSKIEHGGGSGGVPHCYGGLTKPGCVLNLLKQLRD